MAVGEAIEAVTAPSARALASGVSVSSAPFWFWWLVPVVLTLLVVAGVALARRERPRKGVEAVDDYARFRQAMAQVRESTRRNG
ncbi:hypothetical protein ASD06_02065 [Angustibacter sp. Root456]|nr:hypothetical protein ASD06_02065 [Angustibacter sp. Root456]